MRAAKVIATYGPACEAQYKIQKMVKAGLDAFRLNLAHMKPQQLKKAVNRLRSIAPDIALMADLPGVKLRLKIPATLKMKPGEEIDLTEEGRATIRPWPRLEGGRAGMRTLLGDGRVSLECTLFEAGRIRLCATETTTLTPGTGIAFPEAELLLPGLTENDIRWLPHLKEADVEWVCVSFVRDATEIERVKQALKGIPVLAKIERREAVQNLDDIVEASDGVMVARGDLGLAVGLVEVPLLQKRILRVCIERDRIGLVATQMLDSMREQRVPTRAEVSDVANAIMDGADGVLLTDETAVGRHPVEAVRTAIEILSRVGYRGADVRTRLCREAPIADAVCDAAVRAADDLSATAIACFTATGRTAILLSRYLPKRPIFALTDSPKTKRKMRLIRGVTPVLLPEFTRIEEVLKHAEKALLERGLKKGDIVVFASGTPVGVAGRTDTLLIRHLGGN